MSLVRSLEKRLERLLEGVAGRVFSGRLHPTELAGKLAREADFARFEHPTGPATANLFIVEVNPRDLSGEPEALEELLATEMEAYTAEEGLRLEGPIEVRIKLSDNAPSGRARCHVEVSPGPPVVWANLVAAEETVGIGRNRVVIGRSAESDVVIPHDDVSRRHALLFREDGQAWVRDLRSANGTTVDGLPVGSDPVEVQVGSVVTLGEHRYRFVEV